MAFTFTTGYQAAGVNTDQENEALKRLVKHLRPTWPTQGTGRVALDIGYFANVLDLGGIGLAITADGVGTKVMIAQLMDRYNTIGIDCVAMNVNDLLCVGATPISMVDYLAIEMLNPDMIEAIAEGLAHWRSAGQYFDCWRRDGPTPRYHQRSHARTRIRFSRNGNRYCGPRQNYYWAADRRRRCGDWY